MTNILLIDNYDSFTYNLLHYLQELGAKVEVARNDQLTPAAALARDVDGLLISPGPAAPDDAGICLDLVHACAEAKKPLLGVCLGHQSIAQAFGGTIVRAPEPVHGKTSAITHEQNGIFKGLSNPFTVTRYHSLIAEKESLPDCLTITAQTDDGIIMGLEHKQLPIHGVQFHPESIASEHGHDLLKNFLELL